MNSIQMFEVVPAKCLPDFWATSFVGNKYRSKITYKFGIFFNQQSNLRGRLQQATVLDVCARTESAAHRILPE